MTKRINRNILICSVVGVLLLTLFTLDSPVLAKGPGNVAFTVHNLQAGNPYGAYNSNVDEVCVFCHTPHGGSLSGPLWNHSLPSSTSFTHYNSVTLSGYIKDTLSATRVVEPESLLCMACHDGSVAISHLLNDPNSLNGAQILFDGFAPGDDEILDMFGGVGARIGGSLGNTAGTGDLSDDHPISFSYFGVWSQGIYQGGSRDGELNSIAVATAWKGEGVRFFGATSRVECASCHDPHVDYDIFLSGTANPAYTPFLIRPNSGSDLCLACHNK